MRTRLCLALVLVASSPALVRADSLDDRFGHALQALDHHRPEEAAIELRRIVGLGVDDPDVYLDLGIAEAESMRYGHAMAAFERALSLRPGDAVAKQGLENATTMLARRDADRGGATIVDEPAPLASFGRAMPEPLVAIGFGIGVWLAALAGLALTIARREVARIAAGSLLAIGLVAGAVFGAALLGRARFGDVLAPAIVVASEARVRVAPDPSAPASATLSEGRRVEIVELHGAHARIRAGGRVRGWLPRAALATY